MKNTVLGCIGCGNMGGAIMRGLAGVEGLQLAGFNRSAPKVEALRDEIGLEPAPDAVALARRADIILLGVKPDQICDVIGQVRPVLDAGKVLVSIAAGVSLEAMRSAAQGAAPVVRVMPNTPAMVGRGIYGMCLDDPALSAEAATAVRNLFAAIGKVIVLPEQKFEAFTAVAGCGPAYVFHMMEAVIEAAVTVGFTRQQATEMVTELFSGSCALAEQTGMHPSLLREMVTSPAGTTIAGTNHLDRTAVRGHIIDAVLAAYEKGLAMRR
ncbi:pyrroline-5-carboxylate reductase [Oleidesulfovibrio alaskensis]|jgi:pyrroline-5-carboxylate reductase|uniref:pyrroline-5-carboxylate reductase n=1 Tax=Oleidesulfovibrio alaskensis TaxID=58180 RepID=UPI000413000E|nr:pyrroline-5-carboxylate reductase [Oleidesulfovibrio alaskensis]MBL3581179.1 pyrroline-5-carboxylate reductase [Oleidesulfovibrio alaskensis]